MSITLTIAATFVGCSSRPVQIGAPLPPASEVYEVVGPSEGGGCGLLLFGLVPLGINSRTQRAYAEAVGSKGIGLVDAQVQYSWWFVPYVGTIHCAFVKGTVVR